jgi:putative ABC transport system permease protein
MSGALLALREMRRAKLRFGLLAVAVGFLSFLIVFQQALLGQLVEEFVGAVRQQSADVLVYSEQSRVNLQASVLGDDVAERVGAVEGVAEVGPLAVATLTVQAAGEAVDATLVGYRLGSTGGPRTVSAGRLADRPGEAVASTGSEEEGFGLGDEVVAPGDERIEIVGLATDASLNVTPTLYLDRTTADAARRAQNPDAAVIPVSALAVVVEDGADPAAVAQAVTDEVDGVEAFERDEAADRTPGVESINQSLAIIIGLSYVVILIVTGFFFLILTVQKAAALTLLRALGAPARSLVVTVLTQAAAVILVGFALGTVLSRAALSAGPLSDARLDPGQVLTTLVILLVLGVLASVGSIRRVLRIEPVEATVPTGGIR